MPAPRYATPLPPPETILRLPTVIARTGRGRASIYADIAAGTFPKPVRLGPRAVGWRESDINTWLASLVVGTAPAPAGPAKRRAATGNPRTNKRGTTSPSPLAA